MPATLVIHELSCTKRALAFLALVPVMIQHANVARITVFAGVRFDLITRNASDLAVEYRTDRVPDTMPALGTSVYRTSLTVRASDARFNRVLEPECPDACALYYRHRVVSHALVPANPDYSVYMILHGAMSASAREAIAGEYARACAIHYRLVEAYECNSSGARHTFHGVSRAGEALIGDGECYYLPGATDTIVSVACKREDVKIKYHDKYPHEYESISIGSVAINTMYKPVDPYGAPDWFVEEQYEESEDGTSELEFLKLV